MQVPGLDLEIQTIFGIGRNYLAHAKELGNDVPGEPIVFLKPLTSVIYDGGSIVLPQASVQVEYEGELVVAIGKEAKNISGNEATSHIAGYGIGIDVTARDLQREAMTKSAPWAISKGFDTFAPLGPFVSSESVGELEDLQFSLSLNGEIRQKGDPRDMVFSIGEQISYLSRVFTLRPGDLIFTGTPSGVGPLKSGDKIQMTLGNGLGAFSVDVQ